METENNMHDNIDVDDNRPAYRDLICNAYDFLNNQREDAYLKLFRKGFRDYKRGFTDTRGLSDMGFACYDLGAWYAFGNYPLPEFAS